MSLMVMADKFKVSPMGRIRPLVSMRLWLRANETTA
jgi:hypothetical protein